MPIWLNNTPEVKRLTKKQSVRVEEERAREKAEGKAEKEQRKLRWS
jgi:hypothetical protein